MSVADDGTSAQIVWESTPGVIVVRPNAGVIDVSFVLSGRGVVRAKGEADIPLEPDVLAKFPDVPYEVEVAETVRRVSFVYSPVGGLGGKKRGR